MKDNFGLISIVTVVCATAYALGHDTWVQTNTNVVRTDDAIYVSLMLGNHGNDHRDFKLASKIDLAACKLEIVTPDGRTIDLKDRLIDTGYAPKEGFWQGKFVPAQPGLHLVSHQLDKIVEHGKKIRAVKSGKTFFVASPSLDKVVKATGFDKPLGHPIELVPESNPVTDVGPGKPIKVRLLFKGKPLSDARVSFIPHGEKLAEGFDEKYERKTDAEGRASFIPASGNWVLIVVHHKAPDESGQGYESTSYSATLTVLVPEKCPCCEE